MVLLSNLVADAVEQVSYLDGDRKQVAKCYLEVLKKYPNSSVNFSLLLEMMNEIQLPDDLKGKLLKMVKVNYNHAKSKESLEFQRLMDEVNTLELKPLSEVVLV